MSSPSKSTGLTSNGMSIKKAKNRRVASLMPPKVHVNLHLKTPDKTPKTTGASANPATSFNFNSTPLTKEYSFTSMTSTLASSQNAKPFVTSKKCVKEKKFQEITRMYLDDKHRQHGSCYKSAGDEAEACVPKGESSCTSGRALSGSGSGENRFRRKQSVILNHLAREFFLG